jgi:peptide methionine sulfoxide reductase MsrA
MNKDAKAPPNPSYREVCSRNTGYVEVAHILFDSSKVNYEDLVKFFFSFHDPT